MRGGEGARRAAFGCCCAGAAGVLGVGTWTLVDPSAFPDATVWSDYGMGYLFIPVVLPVTGLLWLRRARDGGIRRRPGSGTGSRPEAPPVGRPRHGSADGAAAACRR